MNNVKKYAIKGLAALVMVSTISSPFAIGETAFGDVNSDAGSKQAESVNEDLMFGVGAFQNINDAYSEMCRRRDYSDITQTNANYTYDDLDKRKYSREKLTIQSGQNKLAGFLYGAKNKKGIVVISLGMHEHEDSKIEEIKYFVDKGWKVLIYDYTGMYGSEGEGLGGYGQVTKDLDCVLTYLENNKKLKKLPIMLFGHSLGGYASGAALNYKHKNVKAAFLGSPFNTPRQIWIDSTVLNTKMEILRPYADMFMTVKCGDKADFSVVDGINAKNIPVFVVTGNEEEVYLNKYSEVYLLRDKITNPNCHFKVIDIPNHNTHNGYWYTDAALEYREKIGYDNKCKVDKALYNQHDTKILDEINEFYLKALLK